MDEPFGALDAITRMKLQDDVRKICSLHSKTIIMVTHDVDEALYLGDRVIVMKPSPGRIALDIPVDITRPRMRNDEQFTKLRFKLLEKLDLASKKPLAEYNI